MPCDDVIHTYLDTDTTIFADGFRKRTFPLTWCEERDHCRIWFCREYVNIDGHDYSLVHWKYIP